MDDADRQLTQVQHDLERVRFALAAAIEQQGAAAAEAESALGRLHESDARLAAVAEQLGLLGQAARAATGEADRLAVAEQAALEAAASDEATLTDLDRRLAQAESEESVEPLVDGRAESAAMAQQARAREVEARLALRTGEERLASLESRVESLERAAQHERWARRRAAEGRELRKGEAEVASSEARG
ncbi:MAG: hypothetical protein VW239_03525, partial [Candidatus Nanopelagicales bacterium]